MFLLAKNFFCKIIIKMLQILIIPVIENLAKILNNMPKLLKSFFYILSFLTVSMFFSSTPSVYVIVNINIYIFIFLACLNLKNLIQYHH